MFIVKNKVERELSFVGEYVHMFIESNDHILNILSIYPEYRIVTTKENTLELSIHGNVYMVIPNTTNYSVLIINGNVNLEEVCVSVN